VREVYVTVTTPTALAAMAADADAALWRGESESHSPAAVTSSPGAVETVNNSPPRVIASPGDTRVWKSDHGAPEKAANREPTFSEKHAVHKFFVRGAVKSHERLNVPDGAIAEPSDELVVTVAISGTFEADPSTRVTTADAGARTALPVASVRSAHAVPVPYMAAAEPTLRTRGGMLPTV